VHAIDNDDNIALIRGAERVHVEIVFLLNQQHDKVASPLLSGETKFSGFSDGQLKVLKDYLESDS
jgi:hypothetical protein